MASGNFVSIIKDVSCPKNSQTAHISDPVTLENHMVDFLLCAKCTGSGTVNFTLEHSPDGSSGSFSAVTDSAGKAIEFQCTTGASCECAVLDTPLLLWVRATCHLSGEETALCNLDLYYRTQK